MLTLISWSNLQMVLTDAVDNEYSEVDVVDQGAHLASHLDGHLLLLLLLVQVGLGADLQDPLLHEVHLRKHLID